MEVYMRRFALFALITMLMTTAAFPAFSRGTAEQEESRLKVVTTLFPLYDFSREVGGDLINVTLILPPGVEAHSFEPSPRDMITINNADVFIYTGEAMEPWAGRVIRGLTNRNITIVDTSLGMELIEGHHHHHDDDHHDGEDHHHDDDHHDEEENHYDMADPHIWTDPVRAKSMVERIAEGFAAADPAHRDIYFANAASYKEKLEDLHQKISHTLEHVRVRTILYGGHFAFGYFAQRYDLDHVSPYAGFSPNAEPTPGSIIELIRLMRELELSVIFHEELIEPRVARIIAEETGAELMLLHGIHNVSRDELARGESYLSLMEQNLERLALALEAQ